MAHRIVRTADAGPPRTIKPRMRLARVPASVIQKSFPKNCSRISRWEKRFPFPGLHIAERDVANAHTDQTAYRVAHLIKDTADLTLLPFFQHELNTRTAMWHF